MKLYFTLDLKNDPKMIEQYEYWHKPENIWREIPLGINEVGITEMEIFRWKNRLIMVIEVPEGFEWDKAMIRLQELPLQSKWEKFMNKFQELNNNKEAGNKWKPMKKIFTLSACNN